jgi:hypothetical protein
MRFDSPESVTAYDAPDFADNISILQEIQKAFEAGHDIDISSLTGGQAGRVQSLEETFKVITFKEEAARFWKEIPKKKVSSTVLEYARINEVANSVFYSEGGDVDNQDDDMDRKYDLIKYMGVKGTVTYAAKSVKMIQDAEITETNNKMRSMCRGLDIGLWKGDSSINVLEFDGVFKIVKDSCKNPSQNVIDKRGKRITDEDVNDAVTCIKDNYGEGQLKFWMSLNAKNGYVKEKILNKTYFTNAGGDLNPTQTFRNFEVANGEGEVKTDVFLRAENPNSNRIVTAIGDAFKKNHTKAPDAPTVALTSVVTDTDYQLDDGFYDYAVVPFNQYGEGTALESTIEHSGGGKKSQFVITAAATGEATLGYKIYRRSGELTDIRRYFLVKTYKKTAAEITVFDDGQYIPGTTSCALIEWDSDQTICCSQLSDMMKLPYGTRYDKKEWLQKIYVVLQVFNPNRIVVFENVGDLPNS